MNAKRLATKVSVAIVVASVGISLADPGSAAPGAATHRQDIKLVDLRGDPVTKQKDRYRYVVPGSKSKGAFYTYEKKRYFTPAVPSEDGDRPVSVRPEELRFGGLQHHHELAERLERLTNEFCLDLYYNYGQNPHFRETYREAYQLLQAAKSVHHNADHGLREEIQQSVTSIDNLFHHIQEDVQDWVGEVHRPVGRLSLPAKVEELEALIHHLMFDMGVEPDHHEKAAPSSNDEAAPPPEESPQP